MDSGIVFLSDHAPSENKDQYDYFPDSQNVATYSDFIIPQCDGNDSIDDVDDTAVSITGANNILTKVANFELNRAKQTAGIYRDAQNQDFTLLHKDHDKNINIECSSGFYSQVAKPTLCSLAQDYIPPVLGHTIICDNITKNIDASGSEYNLTLFFKVSPENGREYKVTIHTHNSTRLVQVQGGATMPDKTTAALWFVTNVLHGKFQVLAKSRRFNISGFNNAIINGVASFPLNPTKMKCGGCGIQFDSRAKPLYCSKCTKWFHKTNCHKGHRCFLLASAPDTPSSSQTGTQSSNTLLPPSDPTTAVTTGVPSPTTSVTSSPISSLPAVITSSLSLVPAPAPSAQLSSSPITIHSFPLNPSAQQFIPASSSVAPPPLLTRQRRPRQEQSNLNNSPRKAEVESLKIELGYAHTKIAEIQSRNRDHQETIRIYSQKLELMEKSQTGYLHEKYFSSSLDTTSSLDCPCQTKSKISRNTENLKSLELKIMHELERLNARLEHPRPAAQPAPSSQPPSSHPPQQSPVVPEDISPTQNNQQESFTQRETVSQFTFDDINNHDEPENVDEDAQTCSASTHQLDSDFEFSDNFDPPELSPKIPLNEFLMTTQT